MMRSRSFSACILSTVFALVLNVVLPTSAVNRAAGSNSLSVKVEIAGLDQHRISWVETEPTVVSWEVIVSEQEEFWFKNTTANELYIDSRNFADFKNADGVAWGGFVREDPAATVTYYVRGFTADGNAYPSEGNAYQSSIPAHIPVVSQSLPPTNISMHAKNAPSSLACEDRKVGVTVKWSRPVDQGMGTDPMYRNSPLAVIVNYLVEISSSQDFSGEAAAIVSTGTNTTVTVMGLKEGTIYYARITPETSAGNGVTSDVTAGVAASEVPCDAVQVILGGEVLPKQEYAQCRIYATWEDFWYCHDGGLCPYKTGELEKKLSEKGVVERWVCYNHPCGALGGSTDTRFCYVYHEQEKVFVAWGPHSNLQLIRAADEL